jgi:hypothetical protein
MIEVSMGKPLNVPRRSVALRPNGRLADNRSTTETLLALAKPAELFHADDGATFADIVVGDHRETWPLRSKGFRRWLAHGFYRENGGAPASVAFSAALNVLEARAQFDGPERPVFVRVGEWDGRLYLDLADDTWRAVEIGADGWRVVDVAPIRFRRRAGMLPLPVPRRGGSVAALRSLLNARSEDDLTLIAAWLLAALRARGPYPVLVISGEQGSAKSTMATMLRALVDPNVAPLRTLPRDDRDLFIAATNSHMLAFDNVSGLPHWLSDTLCRLASGGSFATRQLYTDREEVLLEASRPIIINGIEDMVSRPDLADRALFVALDRIPESRRRPERELDAAFRQAHPLVLGALLDAAAHGMRTLPSLRPPRLPRMADFALWAVACEAVLWEDPRILAAYTRNRREAIEGLIETDFVGHALIRLARSAKVWRGTASDLLVALNEGVDEISRPTDWPHTPRALAGQLRRLAPALRQLGVSVRFSRIGRDRARVIEIRSTGV